MSLPLISIIIPVYKVEAYLCRCLDSVLAQTYTDIEVILVDDGSPDACPSICDAYAARDSRIVVIHQQNAGVSAARNAGLDIARGEYVSFVDSDDWIEPDMYEVLYAVLRESDSDISISYDCIGDYVPTRPNIDEFIIYSPSEAISILLNDKYDFRTVWGKLIARDIVSDIRFSSAITIGEDALFFAKVIVNSRKLAYIGYQSYHYTMRADSATHEMGADAVSFLDAIDTIVELIREFDSGLVEKAESRALYAGIFFAKQFEAYGEYTSSVQKRISCFLRSYMNKESLRQLPNREKFWAMLIMLGRGAFVAARRSLSASKKVKEYLVR